MLKRLSVSLLAISALFTSVLAQDSVTVTFRYKPSGAIFRAFVPGEFNNWGPNAAGVIATTAPSLMALDNGVYYKSVRLKVGGGTGTFGGKTGYMYKIHEHVNSSGTTWNWLADPLNPIKVGGDGNSLIIVKSPMVFQIQPANSAAIDNAQPGITASVASKNADPIDENASEIFLNDVSIGKFGSFYDKTKQLLHVPSISSLGATLSSGANEIKIKAVTTSGAVTSDSTTFSFLGSTVVIKQRTPAGIIEGINYDPADPTKVTLCLFAPRKKTVHVIGDFNNWLLDNNYLMKLDSVNVDSMRWWITLTGLESGKEYGFQYLVDGSIRIADPYTEKVLSSDDQWISATTYPNLKPYPGDKTTFAVSVFQTNQQPYNWQVTNFQRPKNTDLVIYELLLRDFVARHDYQTLSDTLAYLKRLGINAIQLMPVQEFEGNESWGYNSAFYFAPDKYYGPKNDLKKFIDECHKRGIAVILDVVYNHSFGQSPFVRLYSTGDYGPPTSQNYWFNTVAKHPYNVGYDMNHESVHTKYLLDRANKHWLTEYKFDGYRYDLSKGFTQFNSGDNVGLWGNYDQSRVNILSRMYNKVREFDASSYMILEHLGGNAEEKVLADIGFMLWGNMNDKYEEAIMGFHDSDKSNLSWGYHGTRSWTVPHVVAYMESHDEERIMYKPLRWGNVSGAYNVKDTTTALKRAGLSAAFFLTIPGPKMIWQFGEVGYNYSIFASNQGVVPEPYPNDQYKLDKKPIRWDFYKDPRRRELFNIYSELNRLKVEEPAFETNNVSMSVVGAMKRINLYHADMDVVVIGNFGVTAAMIDPNFSKTGRWYDFFGVDSIEVASQTANINLEPGEFRIYTTKRLWVPGTGTSVSDDLVKAGGFLLNQNYPNPFNPTTTISFSLANLQNVKIVVYDMLGREVKTLYNAPAIGENFITWDGTNQNGQQVSTGMYLYKLEAGSKTITKKMLLMK
ncbi:MAG: T9SS type A sorting domain-containing protein [Bacteroidetes bacterium]|nr:T9SS type A sorting domain-containing protein [Bacteroidota bacterium]